MSGLGEDGGRKQWMDLNCSKGLCLFSIAWSRGFMKATVVFAIPWKFQSQVFFALFGPLQGEAMDCCGVGLLSISDTL